MSAPRIDAVVTMPDGSTSCLLLTVADGYQQWGAGRERLGDSVELAQILVDAFADWASERECPSCGGYVNNPEDLAVDDHERHCDACRADCHVCRRADAVEARWGGFFDR